MKEMECCEYGLECREHYFKVCIKSVLNYVSVVKIFNKTLSSNCSLSKRLWKICEGLLRRLIKYSKIQLLYSEHFIFFTTFEWTQKAVVFVTGKTLQPSVMLHSSWFGAFVSYEEIGLLWAWPGMPWALF